MKMFIFRDGLFCWVCAVVASSLDEAVEFAEQAGHIVSHLRFYEDDYTGYEIKEIVSGLIIEGGGNG